MNRRKFFGWLGKVCVALGIGYLAFRSGELEQESTQARTKASSHSIPRMNGAVCYDARIISPDRSFILDRQFLSV